MTLTKGNGTLKQKHMKHIKLFTLRDSADPMIEKKTLKTEVACGKFPLRGLKMVECEGQGSWYCLRVLCCRKYFKNIKTNKLNFNEDFSKNYEFT